MVLESTFLASPSFCEVYSLSLGDFENDDGTGGSSAFAEKHILAEQCPLKVIFNWDLEESLLPSKGDFNWVLR